MAEMDNSPPDRARSQLLRPAFTKRQWHACMAVIDTAPADIDIDELRLAVCRARLTNYRSNP